MTSVRWRRGMVRRLCSWLTQTAQHLMPTPRLVNSGHAHHHDFGVGLFDLHGTLTLTQAATLVGVALNQVRWAISFMAGAQGNGSGVVSAGILGAGWAP
jgi:hypothetical protein